jgi:hypothetical protein
VGATIGGESKVSDLVELNIDLRAGTIGIKAGASGVTAILDRVESLLDRFWSQDPIREANAGSGDLASSDATSSTDVSAPAAGGAKQEAPAKRSSSRGTSKRVNWNITDLGISADRRKFIKDEFEKMLPKTQNEQVAAVAILLRNQLKTSEFDGHAIASGLRIAGCKIPGNIGAVFGNMKNEHLIDIKDGKLVVTAFLEDFVKDMPAKNEKKKPK